MSAFGYDDCIGPEGQQDEEDQTFTQGQIEIPPSNETGSDETVSNETTSMQRKRHDPNGRIMNRDDAEGPGGTAHGLASCDRYRD